MTSYAPPLCIGHSHVTCVEEAAREQAAALTAINFWQAQGSLMRDPAGAWRLTPPTIERIIDHRAPIFSLVGGASYGVLGMLVHPRPWDFVPPNSAHKPIDVGAELIPFDAVKATLLEMMREYLDITAQIAVHAANGVFQIEPPPPYAHASRIEPHIPWGLYPGMQQKISPASLRLKLWRTQSDILREHCLSHGVRFIPHPPEAADAAGFMTDEFFFDGAHANSAYGALVLHQMRQIHAASI